METKVVHAPLRFKDGDQGAVIAVFSTFDVVDHDGDIVLATAFTPGQEVPMAWAHDWNKPVGKGHVVIEEKQAVFDGGFFIETAAGAEAYKTVKAMGDLQEWSWGFRILKANYGEDEGESIRYIEKAELFEVSPVLVGAGIGTGTRAIKEKSQTYVDQAEAALAAVVALVERTQSLADLRAKDGRRLSEAHRERLGEMLKAMQELGVDIESVLKMSEPPPDIAQLFIVFQHTRAALSGVAT